MTPDGGSDTVLERAYPYCAGIRDAGCAAFFFIVLGAAGAAMLPYGCEQIQVGKLPLGVALVTIGLFTAPMLLIALLLLYSGFRDTMRPPLLRITPSALYLPVALRNLRPEQESQDERGEPTAGETAPAHPAEIPFATVRWVRRESKINPGSDRLMIVHDLAPIALIIERYMMCREDFDELEAVLRAALPAAFAAAPPIHQ